jgi:hypothetical protein
MPFSGLGLAGKALDVKPVKLLSPAVAIAGALSKKKKAPAASTAGAMTNIQGAY